MCAKDQKEHFLRASGLRRLDRYAIFIENNARYVETIISFTWFAMSMAGCCGLTISDSKKGQLR